MKKHLNIIYVIVVAALAIFALRLQLMGQLEAVDQALTNQSQAVQALRSDVNTIATFLNERTNVRVNISSETEGRDEESGDNQ